MNPARTWINLLKAIPIMGGIVSPRGQKTYELLNVQYSMEDHNQIINSTGRKWQYGIPAIEALTLVGQTSIPPKLTRRWQAWQHFTDDGVLWGAYGPRIAGDVGQIVKVLKDDPFSRQAVLTIFDSNRDLNRGVRDVPCTISIQFLYRTGQLHMRVNMRSNDVWLGFPYDTIQFFALHSAIAAALGVPVGTYTHCAGSLHQYVNDEEKVLKVLESEEPFKTLSFDPPYWTEKHIGGIVETAQNILISQPPRRMTLFEEWLAENANAIA